MATGNKKRKSTGSDTVLKSKKSKNTPTDPLQRLQKIISNNYYTTLKGENVTKEVLDLIKGVFGITKFDLKEKGPEGLFLAFNVGIDFDKKSEEFGIIIGPNTVSEQDEIAQFYQVWGGKKFCSLRRFQDGSTHETVALNNPGGVIYMPLAKIKHLIQVHAPTVQLSFHHFNEDFRQQVAQTHQNLLLHRQKVEEFCGKIRQFSEELPIRKIQPVHSSMYKGFANHQLSEIHSTDHSSSKVVVKGDSGILQISETSKIAPSKLNAVKIVLDISAKQQMSSEMFARLKCAYVMKLQEKFQFSILKNDSELFVIDHDVVYQICIKAPNDHQYQDQVLLQEKLASVGLQHTIYPSLCQLVHQWLASQYLSKIIDGVLVDVIIASILSLNSDSVTIENGLLKFLHWCSFTDFTKETLVFGEAKSDALDKAKYDFKLHREKYPHLTLFITDLDMESKISQGLDNKILQRLINCARGTLHQLSNHMDFDALLNDAFGVDEKVFDAVLTLKPFQVPVKSKSGKFKKENFVDFPIVDYDPLRNFWEEIHASFGHECQFYLNSTTLKIGIKFSASVSDTKVIVEDIQVLGKDFIKECVLNQ